MPIQPKKDSQNVELNAVKYKNVTRKSPNHRMSMSKSSLFKAVRGKTFVTVFDPQIISEVTI